MSAPATHLSRPLVGIAFKLGSAFSFSCMGACVKMASSVSGPTHFPVGEIVFARSFFALIPLFVWLAATGALSSAFVTENRMGHIRRGIVGSLGMGFGFAGLAYLPLPDATAISFAAPLFSTVLAALVLGEVVRLFRWSAVLVGFVGVIVMLWPHLSAEALMTDGGTERARGAAFGLAGALAAAFALIEVRKLTWSETTGAIVLHFSLLTTVLGVLSLLGGAIAPDYAWVKPDGKQALFLLLTGISGGFGQIFLTEAYRRAPASLVAPFDYTAMIFAILWGYMLFGDWPEPLVLLGAGIVAASGIAVIWRERALNINRGKDASAGPSRSL
ncbi:MAG: DMT family transporter [Proteobacteria bacterium]|nr:DMT family transporter [Pseudomonadota bacterium]